jgi:hypothetical protein
MSARLARTAGGWWLVTPVGPIRLGLTAPTMARLLAGRAALDAAIQAGRKAAAAPRQAVPAGSLDLLSPVTAHVRSVAQMVNYPTGSTLAEPSVWSSWAASCGACELSARMMIGQAARRKVSAAACQPVASASPQVTNGRRTTATISPAMSTVMARRVAGACQPSHRWYRVGAGRPVIV